ncbi:MAG: DUF881 domain-containing protein [Actinobacteria bacterium]|nr:DUF881 domain-containing protein [Actinomycetota bacterium]MBI3686247.1 DUF881 domain-containing protein [Actinomycetota bacterium]
MGARIGERVWAGLVPTTFLLAGLLFGTSAETAHGTDLRPSGRPDLSSLIAATERRVGSDTRLVTSLEDEVDRLDRVSARNDTRVASVQAGSDALAGPVGLNPVHGPGLTVVLNDAPRRPDGSLPPNARNVDDVVVHQQDVQAVVNALWAGGADAMTIQDLRVISTGAVKCVGNTLLLYGHVYSPPFRITAIGDPARLRASLEASNGVQQYRLAVEYFGLGYRVTSERDVVLVGYDGPVRLGYAETIAGPGGN